MNTPARGPGRPFPKDNPGKPKGARHKASRVVETLLEGEAEEIGRKCIEMAREGDSTALRLAMERLCPVRRARVRFDLPPIVSVSDLPKAVGAVLAAIADGTLSPDEGSAIGNSLSLQCRVLELSELERRIVSLEQARTGA